jgi:hypothetical protein
LNRGFESGGEGGIRTLDTLLGYGALAKRCFQPLSHLTKRADHCIQTRFTVKAICRSGVSVAIKTCVFYRLLFSVIIVVSFCGCAGKRTGPTPPVPHLLGRIALVNENLKFVLIDVGTYYSPKPGQALKTFRAGTQTGILAVTPEYKRPFVAADIIQGNPAPGDAVYE